MAQKKKNARTVKIFFGALVLFLVFGLGFRWELGTAMDIRGYVYLAVGVLSVFIFIINLGGDVASSNGKHEHETSGGFGDTIFGFMTFVVMMGLLFGGMLLWIIPLNIKGVSPEEYASVSEGMFYIFITDILSIAGAMICMSAESKYIVKPGHLVLMGGKVLYPGEKYRIWQWEYGKAQAVSEEFLLKIESLEVESKNNEKVDVRVATFVKLDINEAKKMGVTHIDLAIVFRDAETRLSQEIKKQARSIALGNLLKGNLDPGKFIIAGVPVIWEGRVQISTG